MKLRLEPHLLRLRLDDADLAEFRRVGRLSCALRLGPDPAHLLSYTLEQRLDDTENSEKIKLRYAPGQILVQLSPAQAVAWLDGKKIGLDAQIDVGDGEEMRIIVEKDLGYQH